MNVVGPDGNYYEPKNGPLKPYSMTGQFPKGWGNRPDKAPIRYFGRFFYCAGEADVDVPAGAVRIEVWKGLEYRPGDVMAVTLATGESRTCRVARVDGAIDMRPDLLLPGDAHLHFLREHLDADDRVIFDLLEAEGVRLSNADARL